MKTLRDHNETGWFEGSICENYRCDEIAKSDYASPRILRGSRPRRLRFAAHRGIPGSHENTRHWHSHLRFFVSQLVHSSHGIAFSPSLVRSARSLAQVADDRRADTCARVGACVPHVTKTRRVGPAYIRPAALEMESVFDMLRPLHFVSGPHSTLASSTSILSSQRRFSFLIFSFLYLPASASRVHALSLSLSTARNVNRESD